MCKPKQNFVFSKSYIWNSFFKYLAVYWALRESHIRPTSATADFWAEIRCSTPTSSPLMLYLIHSRSLNMLRKMISWRKWKLKNWRLIKHIDMARELKSWMVNCLNDTIISLHDSQKGIVELDDVKQRALIGRQRVKNDLKFFIFF